MGCMKRWGSERDGPSETGWDRWDFKLDTEAGESGEGEQRKQGSPPRLGKGCCPSIRELNHTRVRFSKAISAGRAYPRFRYLDT